jgi:exosortase/archaeosortase family protein
MTRNDLTILLGLAFLAVFIWLRDTAWVTTSDDTIPIMLAIPLFIWLGAPWKWRNTPPHYSLKLVSIGAAIFSLGIGSNITLLLTIGWVIFLSAWLTQRLTSHSLSNYYKLLALPLLAFPWISLDLSRIGWWFRLSGAYVTEHVFSWTGFDVIREGTILIINGQLISIDVACAGLNTLQAMLIAGTIVAYAFLGQSKRYWLAFPLLVVIGWISNTLRIIITSLLALAISPAFVMGPFHIWIGWVVLVIMFALSWLVFSLLAEESP